MYLEEPLKTVIEQYNEAYSKRIQVGFLSKHLEICWYYSEPLNQYVSNKDYYTLSKIQNNKVLFANKKDAQKYQKYKRELYRLINIYVQKSVDDSINKLQNIQIDNKVLDQWRQEFWYK